MSNAAAETNYDRIDTPITQAVNNAVARSTHTMLLSCLKLVQPFMKYTLACGGLNGGKETHAQDVGTTTHSAVEKFKKDWEKALKRPFENEEEEEFDTRDVSSEQIMFKE
jgi:hypothetical protein